MWLVVPVLGELTESNIWSALFGFVGLISFVLTFRNPSRSQASSTSNSGDVLIDHHSP
jgi:hypothetical protein